MQLLKNPGFREGTPTYWGNYNTGNTQIYTYPEQGRADGYSVAIEYRTREIGKAAAWAQNIDIDSTKKYKFSGWMKTQNIVGGGAIMKVDWKTSTGGFLGTSNIMERQIETIPWTYFIGVVTPNQNADIATINLELYDCSGKVWFDDLSFGVELPILTTITITPKEIVAIGGTKQLVATCKDQSGNIMNCPTLIWKSSNINIATVDPKGLVRGINTGTANITAYYG